MVEFTIDGGEKGRYGEYKRNEGLRKMRGELRNGNPLLGG
jgi:hypothetical protein